jgi:hypothetical protein
VLAKLLSPRLWRAKITHEWQRSRLRLRTNAAERSFAQQAGAPAVAAMRKALVAAEAYRPWDHWSLSHESLYWVGELLLGGSITRMAEFGAGYSTVALASFCRTLELPTRIESFEHHGPFAERLRNHLAHVPQVRLHEVELLALEEHAFGAIFTSNEPLASFLRHGRPVPAETSLETRLQHAFYRLDAVDWPEASLDLVILDGPNGNGRSLAFPLLYTALHKPAYVLIDDFLDYPFLEDLARITSFDIVRRSEHGGKEAVLVKVG